MRNAVVIIGSGMMGSGIAACAAGAGRRVLLVDTALPRAKQGVEKARSHLTQLQEHELLTKEQAETAKSLIQPQADMSQALAEAQMVIEAITEDLAQKQALFAQIDAMLPPEIPIASNTSGLQITNIAARTRHPERALTTHFWFPAHLVPLVEVVVGQHTDIQFARQVKQELLLWNKAPVIVNQDLPGQLANRILQAVIREAVNIVQIGLASAEDVDTAIKMGMGIRFPVWGPLEHIDGVGLDLGLRVQESVLPEISGEKTPSPILRELVAENNLGVRTGKGFYDWSEKSMDALQEKRDAFIIQAVKFLREH